MSRTFLSLLIVVLAGYATTLLAQEKPDAKKEEPKPAAAPNEAEMMARWMAAATPGKEHEFLKKYEGNWKSSSKMWMAGPDKPPTESTGSSSAKLLLGGRFIRDEVKGTMMGMPFEGLGLTGYDNFKKRFTGTWCDNVGTCLLTMEGSLDASGKVLTMYGRMDDVATLERDKLVKYVTRWESDDRYTFQIIDLSAGPDGQKIMEMTCTRVK